MAQVRLMEEIFDTSGSDGNEYMDAPTRPTKRRRLKRLAGQTKSAPKRILERLDPWDVPGGSLDADGRNITGVTDNPIFNTAEVLENRPRSGSGRIASKTLHSVQTAVHAVVHPKDAAQKRASKMIPAIDRPYLTVEEDKRLIDAHNLLRRSESSTGPPSPVPDVNLQQQSEIVQKLEGRRDDMRTAWITSKHCKRAKRVFRGQVSFPSVEDYREVVGSRNHIVFRWERYLGHLLLYLSEDFGSPYVDDTNSLPFKRGTLLNHAERFFIATSPWQSYLMHVRKVYLWEDIYLTGRWFLTFLFLLKSGYIMTFFYFYICFIVLRNRYVTKPPDALKESHERAMDEGTRVHNITELIMRHGNDQWLDPLLDELGPLIQQQLGDLADYLEILINFYNWRNYRASLYTVIFWMACGTVAALTSAGFGQKIVFWVVGLYFFGSRPIASRYPKYRHLVSIFRWIYWEIPTHVELAFQNLQQQAQSSQKQIAIQQADSIGAPTDLTTDVEPLPQLKPLSGSKIVHEASTKGGSQDTSYGEESSSSEDLEEDLDPGLQLQILSFRARCRDHTGRLVIHTGGVRFVRSLPNPSFLDPGKPSAEDDVEVWSRTFGELTEICKTKTTLRSQNRFTKKIRKSLTPRAALSFKWTDGTEEKVESMQKRDEAFNTIIGFSNIRWQVLPILQGDKDNAFYDSDEKHQNGRYDASKNNVKKGHVTSELGKT